MPHLLLLLISCMSPYSSIELICSPIYNRPFVYEIPDDAYTNGLGRYTVSASSLLEEHRLIPDRASAATGSILYNVHVRRSRFWIWRLIRNPSSRLIPPNILPEHYISECDFIPVLLLTSWKSEGMFKRIRYCLEWRGARWTV